MSTYPHLSDLMTRRAAALALGAPRIVAELRALGVAVSRKTVHAWAAGQRRPRDEVRPALASVLDVEPAAIARACAGQPWDTAAHTPTSPGAPGPSGGWGGSGRALQVRRYVQTIAAHVGPSSPQVLLMQVRAAAEALTRRPPTHVVPLGSLASPLGAHSTGRLRRSPATWGGATLSTGIALASSIVAAVDEAEQDGSLCRVVEAVWREGRP